MKPKAIYKYRGLELSCNAKIYTWGNSSQVYYVSALIILIQKLNDDSDDDRIVDSWAF